MLRINLLPAYIAERRKTKATLAATIAAVALVTAGMFGWFFTESTAVANRETEADAKQAEADAVTAIVNQTNQILAQVKPILDKRDFADAILFYNGWRQKIFRRAAEYTYKDVEYTSMAVGGDTLSINAFSKTVPDVGRYLITMFGNPDVKAVNISEGAIPGYTTPQGAAGGAGGALGGGLAVGGLPGLGGGVAGAANPNRKGYLFAVTAQLIRAVAPPTPPGGAPGAPGSAPGAIPGDTGGPPADEGARAEGL